MQASEYPSHATNVQPAKQWVKVLNESWPPLEVSRRIRDVEPQDEIPVIVRVQFETGEEYLEGKAVWWVNRQTRHVRIAVNDSRLQTGGVTVDPADVRRR
ncbi:hypothetical protein GCM10022234_00020 [Aeromicrobium panaciterrae]|uniref:hypothetical protein n=1 Tax=Aeromicrobium panaciterrae TaxID=363861 RepID=UPI0031D1DE8D